MSLDWIYRNNSYISRKRFCIRRPNYKIDFPILARSFVDVCYCMLLYVSHWFRRTPQSLLLARQVIHPERL